MSAKKYLIVVGGPTASGKTSLAIQLARHFKTEIVSADSRQFYREMQIGTAKPTAEELGRVPHHFIDHLSIHSHYSVGDFEREALQLLEKLFLRHEVILLVGGSGLYIKAVCEGLDSFPPVPPQIRNSVEALYKEEGIERLQEEVRRVDPVYYAEADINNPARLIRALEVWRSSGRPFSFFRQGHKAQRPFIPVYLQLHRPRTELYERINHRVDLMVKQGLVAEAKRLHPHHRLTALQTVGYRELFDHFDGRHSLSEAIRLIKRNTRRYAKRQLTWMRRDGHWKHIGPQEKMIALRYIELVRNENLRITQRPGNDPALSRFFTHSGGLPVYAICLEDDRQVLSAVLLYNSKNNYLLRPANRLPNYRQSTVDELLLHEGIHHTDFSPCFVEAWSSLEPFLCKIGFERVDKLPVGMGGFAPATSDQENSRIYFRDAFQK